MEKRVRSARVIGKSPAREDALDGAAFQLHYIWGNRVCVAGNPGKIGVATGGNAQVESSAEVSACTKGLFVRDRTDQVTCPSSLREEVERDRAREQLYQTSTSQHAAACEIKSPTDITYCVVRTGFRDFPAGPLNKGDQSAIPRVSHVKHLVPLHPLRHGASRSDFRELFYSRRRLNTG